MVNIAKTNWRNLTDIILQGCNIFNITEALPLFLMPLHCIEKIILGISYPKIAWNIYHHLSDLDSLYSVLEEKFGY
jgi:hypothetical protein